MLKICAQTLCAFACFVGASTISTAAPPIAVNERGWATAASHFFAFLSVLATCSAVASSMLSTATAAQSSFYSSLALMTIINGAVALPFNAP